jgi:hypothetical protein
LTGPHVREELGAYVLGALDEHDAARVLAHLDRCEACRSTHEALVAVPALLELVEPHPAQRVSPPGPDVEAGVLADFARARARGGGGSVRRWSRRLGLARPLPAALGGALGGAAVTLAALVLAGAFREGPATQAVTLTSRDTTATARATLGSAGTGTRVDLRVQGLPPTRGGEVYEVWFVRRDGRVSAGTFTVPRRDEVRVQLASAARVGEYRRLGVSREPDGLDPARNGPSVLAGDIAPS